MALTPDEKLILIAVLAALMIFVVYFELRIMRGRNKEIRVASIKRDEIYNAILTTQSVINVVERKGVSVNTAKQLLNSARDARARGEHDRALELCDKAKVELTKASPPGPKRADAGLGADLRRSLDEVAEEIVTYPVDRDTREYKGTRLESSGDPNYLSAKFELGAAESEVETAGRGGRDVSSARSSLAKARQAFDSGDYAKALSLALKARKGVSTEAAREAIPLKKGAEDSDDGCPFCGVPVTDSDAYCGGCGAKVDRRHVCSSCGYEAERPDAFCRKCGAKME